MKTIKVQMMLKDLEAAVLEAKADAKLDKPVASLLDRGDDRKVDGPHTYKLANEQYAAVVRGQGERDHQEDRAFVISIKGLNVPQNALIGQALYNSVFRIGHACKEYQNVGSTLVVCLSIGDKVFTANLGDSRAILIEEDENGKFTLMRLTKTHKPDAEEERIKQAGGGVILGRLSDPALGDISPSLAMSRALGDSALPGVIFEPSITMFKATPGNKYHTLVISDGVHDVLDEKDLAEIFNSNKHENIATLANLIRSTAYSLSAESDNISVVIAPANQSHGNGAVSVVADGHGGSEVSTKVEQEYTALLQSELKSVFGDCVELNQLTKPNKIPADLSLSLNVFPIYNPAVSTAFYPESTVKESEETDDVKAELVKPKTTAKQYVAKLLRGLSEKINHEKFNDEFRTSLINLYRKISKDFNELVDESEAKQTGLRKLQKKIDSSSAKFMLDETKLLLKQITQKRTTQHTRLLQVKIYEQRTRKSTAWKTFGKLALAVILGGVGMIAGIAVGAFIGSVAGASTGPGASISGLVGGVTGGIGAALATGFLLFRSSEMEKHRRQVCKAALEQVKSTDPKLPTLR